MIHCVAFIGKQNEPIFIHSTAEAVEALHFQFLCHSALDLLEERKGKRPSAASPGDLFLGQLSPMEDYRIFGYMTNTNTKIVAICADLAVEAQLKEIMVELHKAFVRAVQNPFQELGGQIRSRQFQTKVQGLVKAYNDRAALQPFP